jgi:hypothetical protein
VEDRVVSGPLYWTDMQESARLDPTVGDEQYVDIAMKLAALVQAEAPPVPELRGRKV